MPFIILSRGIPFGIPRILFFFGEAVYFLFDIAVNNANTFDFVQSAREFCNKLHKCPQYACEKF